jgi:uncharacterized protein
MTCALRLDPATAETGRAAIARGDYAALAKLLTPIAEKGCDGAQDMLGDIYARGGHNVPQDYVQAVHWYRLAAEQGYAPAEYDLGVRYEYGEGVAQDYTQALGWIRKAADQGVAVAQFAMARIYLSGSGVAKDYQQALGWALKAADQGNAEAQFTAAIIYGSGAPGVPRDMVQAYMWADLAVARYAPAQADRRAIAIKDRDIMGSELTAAHLADAKRLAAEWTAKHQRTSR